MRPKIQTEIKTAPNSRLHFIQRIFNVANLDFKDQDYKQLAEKIEEMNNRLESASSVLLKFQRDS